MQALIVLANHVPVWPRVEDYDLLGKRSMLIEMLQRIADVVTHTSRPSFKTFTSNSNLEELGNGILMHDYSEVCIPFSARHGERGSEDPLDIQNHLDETCIWQSKCPEQELFGELRWFIMDGRVALVVWATL